MLHLYIRDETKKKRHNELPHAGFVQYGNPTSYHEAVKLGQTVAGAYNFYVHTGDRIPTREEQLLLPPRIAGKRRNVKLTAALLLD